MFAVGGRNTANFSLKILCKCASEKLGIARGYLLLEIDDQKLNGDLS